jgi:MAP kinase substrate 1
MLNSSLPDSRPRFLLPTHAAAAADGPSPEEPPRRMDQPPPPSSSGRGGGPTTPRRQLQGPRPPRLNVRMESHAIKKPPPAQTGPQGSRLDQHQQPGRAPVIIYDASPKVIHAEPSEFMALVQRLTGPGPAGAQPRPPSEARLLQADHDDVPFLPPELLLSPSAAMSPAARLATIERSVRPMPEPAPLDFAPDACDGTLAAVLGPARPGILSPLPSSLPHAAASGSFSPLPFDPNSLSWINELSPILRAASTAGAGTPSAPGAGGPSNGASGRPAAYYSDPFVPSPRNLLATPTIPSPTTCAEFFGSLPDF